MQGKMEYGHLSGRKKGMRCLSQQKSGVVQVSVNGGG